MLGRLGWAEILVSVVLVVILFGSNKIPAMMKNLADGLNVFKKEMKDSPKGKSEAKSVAAPAVKKTADAKKKATPKKVVKKK